MVAEHVSPFDFTALGRDAKNLFDCERVFPIMVVRVAEVHCEGDVRSGELADRGEKFFIRSAIVTTNLVVRVGILNVGDSGKSDHEFSFDKTWKERLERQTYVSIIAEKACEENRAGFFWSYHDGFHLREPLFRAFRDVTKQFFPTSAIGQERFRPS